MRRPRLCWSICAAVAMWARRSRARTSSRSRCQGISSPAPISRPCSSLSPPERRCSRKRFWPTMSRLSLLTPPSAFLGSRSQRSRTGSAPTPPLLPSCATWQSGRSAWWPWPRRLTTTSTPSAAFSCGSAS